MKTYNERGVHKQMFLKQLLPYKYDTLSAQNELAIFDICLQRTQNLAINAKFTVAFFT